MRGKKTRRFSKVIHSNGNVDDDDEDKGSGGGGDGCSSSNNEGAYDYDGYSYYLLCDLNLSKSSSSMTEFDCLHMSHKQGNEYARTFTWMTRWDDVTRLPHDSRT